MPMLNKHCYECSQCGLYADCSSCVYELKMWDNTNIADVEEDELKSTATSSLADLNLDEE